MAGGGSKGGAVYGATDEFAYNIVESHGGRIELEVEDGVGSRFTIWLPQGVDAKPIVAQQVSRFRI
jgi:signal transduction histidine kinase